MTLAVMKAARRDSCASATVAAKWLGLAPDWIIQLAKVCDQTSQDNVARRLGYSSAVLSAILNKRYQGDLATFRRVFEGVFQDRMVDCPVLGEISSDACFENQREPFSPANPTAARLWSACRSCRFNLRRGYEGEEDFAP